MDDNVVEIIIFVIGAIIWAIKSVADALKSVNKATPKRKKTVDLPEYLPYDNAGQRKYTDRPLPDLGTEELTIDEMIRRGLIEVVDEGESAKSLSAEPEEFAEVSDYVENLNAFAENLGDDMTYAKNEAPVCEVEEVDYEENVHDVDYAEFIRQNGKAAIIISEIILPANSKMRR